MVDWQDLLKTLKEAGLTQQEIAEYCSMGQSTVSELARGDIKTPNFTSGTKLVELHKKHRRKVATS